MQKKVITCDICKSEITDRDCRQNIPVVFMAKQLFGGYTKPYLSNVTIDICQECLQRLITAFPLRATGVQGNDRYYFVEGK